MDTAKLTSFMNTIWDNDIVPTLTDYIRIPNKSPAFDPDWVAHGIWTRSSRCSRAGRRRS